jgi:predicted SprT family Zn-dependent metalloprotease
LKGLRIKCLSMSTPSIYEASHRVHESSGTQTMTREAVATLATELMEVHGVSHFTFGFNEDKRRLGVTKPKLQKIEISIFHADFSSLSELRNTILHEIAHVKFPPVRNGKRWEIHGPGWKACARSIGCTGDRCGTFSATGRDQLCTVSKYVGSCVTCGYKYYRQQKPVKDYKCRCLKGVLEWAENTPEGVKPCLAVRSKYIGECASCPKIYQRQLPAKKGSIYRCKDCKDLVRWKKNI